MIGFTAFVVLVGVIVGAAWWATKDDKRVGHESDYWPRYGLGPGTRGERMQDGLPKWTRRGRRR